jgi:anthranilate phosphoribosyltransferase
VHRFIKAVGSGQKRARDLTRDEGREAMSLICDGQAQPIQVGAFLLSLRMKGEGAEEMAGFVDALTARSARAESPPGTLDVDCHGDGHAGRPTSLPVAAVAAARLGVPVLLRCDLTNPYAKHELRPQLEALGLDTTRPLDVARAAESLIRHRLAVLDLATYCPSLKELVALRPLFGVRTVAQTLMKLLDPLHASARLVGVFHAPYLPSTARALAALSSRRGVCVQAIGGLPEATPGKQLRVAYADAPEPSLLDLRALPVDDPLAAGAAAAALLLHAARALPFEAAAAEARAALAASPADYSSI